MKNRHPILILSVAIIVASTIILVIPAITSKPVTYVGVFKEPYMHIFDSDTTYIVPLIIEDSITKKVTVKDLIINEKPKQTGEMYKFIRDNLGQKCFVTTKRTNIHEYEGITEIVIR